MKVYGTAVITYTLRLRTRCFLALTKKLLFLEALCRGAHYRDAHLGVAPVSYAAAIVMVAPGHTEPLASRECYLCPPFDGPLQMAVFDGLGCASI